MKNNQQNKVGTEKLFSSLTALIKPKTVAIIGASSDPTRIGGRPIAYMLKGDFQGEIFPVNPNRKEVQGIPAFADISLLPSGIDVAVIALPADKVLESLTELGKKKTKSAIVFSSGFSEIGEAGKLLQEAIIKEAKRCNIRMLGPNALGVFNVNIGYYCNFASGLENNTPLKGRIGIATQSGAYGAHLSGVALERGIGTPISVATGNEADISLGEVIGWMAESDEIDVIMAYTESIHNIETFTKALEVAHKAGKPVILQKTGNSDLGKKAALSHTASLSGDDKLLDTFLADYAVIRVNSADELLDIAYLATQKIYPTNNTLGVVTISGGAGIIVSDQADQLKLPMPPMPVKAQEKLKEAISFCSPLNPVDCTAHVLNDLSLVGLFAETMVVEGKYKSILAYFSQSGTVPSVKPKLLAELKRIKEQYPDRLYVMTLIAPDKYGKEYEAAGLALFEEPTRAVNAINAMGKLGAAFNKPLRSQPKSTPLALPNKTPSEAEAKKILATVGIPSVPEAVFTTTDTAVKFAEKIGYPVVMKIASADILHKSEIGGVLLNIKDSSQLSDGFALLMDRAKKQTPNAKLDGVLIAKQIEGGVECFMGIQQDPLYGAFVVFGLGGIFVEVLQDVVFRRCPVDVSEATEMINSIKGAPLLKGARGRAVADIKALAEMLAKLSLFAWQAGKQLHSVDLNPVFAMPEGKGAFVADAVIEINEVSANGH